MSTPCYYCELDIDSCKFCIHEVDVNDLLQQTRREAVVAAVLELIGKENV